MGIFQKPLAELTLVDLGIAAACIAGGLLALGIALTLLTALPTLITAAGTDVGRAWRATRPWARITAAILVLLFVVGTIFGSNG